jgi:transcriptional regulator with XRE-family HTH domain
MIKNNLYNRIKELREKKGVSQVVLAKKIGVHEQTLSRYERGINEIPADVLIKIADFLRPSLGWLLMGEGPMFIEQRPEALRIAEERAPYGDLTPEEREILSLLRENPELKGICRKLLGGRKAIKEALADLQKIPDPSEG